MRRTNQPREQWFHCDRCRAARYRTWRAQTIDETVQPDALHKREGSQRFGLVQRRGSRRRRKKKKKKEEEERKKMHVHEARECGGESWS